MKNAILSTLAATSLAAAFALPPALAGAGHGPAHGGVAREVKNLTYELVAKPDSLTLHISDHGKVIPTQGATAEATLYAGSEKNTVALAPAGDNRLAAKGSFKVGVGVRAVVTVTLAGKPPVKLTFNLK